MAGAIALMMILAGAGPVEQSDGKSLLANAMFERRAGRFDAALRALADAEKQLSTPRLLAEIHRQRGLVFMAQGRRSLAVASFVQALKTTPESLDADAASGDPGLADAVDCARQWTASLTSAPDDQWVKPGGQCAAPPAGEGLDVSAVVPPAPDGPRPEALIEAERDLRPPLGTVLLGGVSLASLGTGIALGAVAYGQATDDDGASDGEAMAVAANVSFAVAGVAATAAIVWWVLK